MIIWWAFKLVFLITFLVCLVIAVPISAIGILYFCWIGYGRRH